MHTFGATVQIYVTIHFINHFLPLLKPDVHLISRKPIPELEQELWTLRSDRFPSDWEGQTILAYINPSGLQFVLDSPSLFPCEWREAIDRISRRW